MTKKMVIPWELKADFRLRAYTSMLKAYLYVTREEFGAATALKLYEKICKIDDREKRVTHSLVDIYKIEGNDAETIADWFDIWGELQGREGHVVEQSKTICRSNPSNCSRIHFNPYIIKILK